MKRIVIMADGKGIRWNNHMGIPKHFAIVKGEKLISRTVKLLRDRLTDVNETEIIVTSHDKRYEFKGSRRYEPKNNKYEIDRFTEELIISDMCFLYGDTYYTEESIDKIIKEKTEDILFFGNKRSIVGIKINDDEKFKRHVKNVKDRYLRGETDKCTGWQVYRSFTGQSLTGKLELEGKFIEVDEMTTDVDTPYDYERLANDEIL